MISVSSAHETRGRDASHTYEMKVYRLTVSIFLFLLTTVSDYEVESNHINPSEPIQHSLGDDEKYRRRYGNSASYEP